ncbi:relaxin-3-like [Siniperca chuatsi]|uniref:relaxin-3-like n=1 Tax=Siniperca chuatsi TaxID=119488 RepID=UPI001CE1C575|nr:relaxin-3-like [Siniperca chuatsi]
MLHKRVDRDRRFLRRTNMRSLPLLVMLLCMLCVAQVQTQDSTNTLRLCGRAFLRAVVYTCGGSRWRRLMGEEETLQNSSREPKLKMTDVPAIDRHWRDQNQAIISVCCQLGCRRSDLSMLC